MRKLTVTTGSCMNERQSSDRSQAVVKCVRDLTTVVYVGGGARMSVSRAYGLARL
jgi:hypothetical protein